MLRIFKTHWFKNLAIGLAATFVFFFSVILVWISTFKIPTLDSFEERRIAQSTKIYDRTGDVLLYDLSQNVKRTVVPFSEISENIKKATLAVEDKNFYSHHGIEFSSIIRAMLVNLGTLDFSQGGSTITQQVIKNSLFTSEKLLSRKLKELVLAPRLEGILSKDQIFNIYLNEIPYGGNLYGVEEASEAFFGKKTSEVTLAEAAYMAALPKAPTYYSPYGQHRDRLENRKNLVLKEMYENNFITKQEYEGALKEIVIFVPREERGIKAPHFVMFVREYLENKYGQDLLLTAGLKVTTTLDYEMQKTAEEIVKKYALQNKEKFNAENASLVAIDPQTGQILTMVGSRDYFDKEIDGNFNIATAHRQPGSAFKPFAYAEAFNKGYTPETALFDLQTEFSTECSPEGRPLRGGAVCYMPTNYDNVYRGPVTMRQALAQSINIPSIKTFYLAGMKDTLNLAKNMGIQSLGDINTYGLTLVLGGGEVSLLDLTSAYSVFANKGERNPYVSVLEITDSKGKSLEQFGRTPTRVLSEATALKISDVLSDNVARAPAFGEQSVLNFPGYDVAVKTGTTNDYRDAWIIGFTPKISVGAWAGNNDNRPMEKKIAGFIVAPMWNEFVAKILPSYGADFDVPPSETDLNLKPVLRGKWQGGVSYLLDRVSGQLATQYTPETAVEERLTGGVHSILFWVDKENPRGPAPAVPSNDPQFSHWETPVRAWAIQNGIPETSSVPTGYDSVHTGGSGMSVSVTSPSGYSVYKTNDKVAIVLNYQSKYSVVKAEYFLNDSYIGSSNISPFVFTFIPEEHGAETGTNTVKVVIYDSVMNRAEGLASFLISD